MTFKDYVLCVREAVVALIIAALIVTAVAYCNKASAATEEEIVLACADMVEQTSAYVADLAQRGVPVDEAVRTLKTADGYKQADANEFIRGIYAADASAIQRIGDEIVKQCVRVTKKQLHTEFGA